MQLVTKKSINHLFEITSWLQSKHYYPNSDYVILTSFAGTKVYALFKANQNNDQLKKYTLMVYHKMLYVFEMNDSRDIKSEFEDEINSLMLGVK